MYWSGESGRKVESDFWSEDVSSDDRIVVRFGFFGSPAINGGALADYSVEECTPRVVFRPVVGGVAPEL